LASTKGIRRQQREVVQFSYTPAQGAGVCVCAELTCSLFPL
jgi:hypothetical protein